MKILIGCEYSGTVRDEFVKMGHEAVSCDFLDTESPGPHYKGDVMDIINDGWDIAIFFPDCTYLTCSAEWAYKEPPYHQKVKPETLVGKERLLARKAASEFFLALYNCKIPKIAIENPVGVMSRLFRKPNQVIHPYMFGDDASKATCLWLKSLPKLIPTSFHQPRIVNAKKRWGNQTDSGQNNIGPSEDRWKIRAKTYQGIATAMANQWGNL